MFVWKEMIVFLFPAFALEAKSRAEAQQMEMKAAAWAEYKEAALVDMMLKVLPEVAREVSTPMLGTKKITMVATGDGPIGAHRMTTEVLDIMASLPETVHKMTGVDVSDVTTKISNRR